MRRATLASPPVFHLESQSGCRISLASDTGARAEIFVLEPDLIRLVVLPKGALNHPRTWTIAPGAEDVPFEGRDRFDTSGFSCPVPIVDQTREGWLVISTDRLCLTLRLVNLHCCWQVRHGEAWRPLASDRPTQAYDFGWWDGRVRHYLARASGEQFFGLGEASGAMNRAGRRFRLSNLDAMGYDARTSDPLYKHIPFYIARRPDEGVVGGFFYDTLSDCSFDFGCEHSNYHGPYRSFVADHGDLDLYVMGAGDIASVVRRFTWLTGRPAATPDWALDYSGSTMGYTDAPDAQAQMGKFLDNLAAHDLPCGSFHLSSGYTSIGDKRYVFHWNRDKFPDPAAFVADYARAGVRLIANIKPALLTDHPEFEEAASEGLFLSDDKGEPVLEQFWDAPGAYLDFTNPGTVAWWKRHVRDQLLTLGVAATWNDNNEYEVTNPAALAHGHGRCFRALEMKPLQTMLMLKASREAQLEHAPDAPPFLISRAGMAGMQRYAQTWSGDNYTSWETLRWNIRMGLSLALSGVSNTGHDVGGFAGPKPDPELFARWVGFGVFMPRFSIHSWNDDGTVNEPWMYPQLIPDIQALMALRTRLKPLLSEALAQYRDTFAPAIRPIFHDFPDDPKAFEDRDDFLLGGHVLVAPVVDPGQTRRVVDLPKGAHWRDGWTDEVFQGGMQIERPAPFSQPPFFYRVER